jgi:hypothetical protein
MMKNLEAVIAGIFIFAAFFIQIPRCEKNLTVISDSEGFISAGSEISG